MLQINNSNFFIKFSQEFFKDDAIKLTAKRRPNPFSSRL